MTVSRDDVLEGLEILARAACDRRPSLNDQTAELFAQRVRSRMADLESAGRLGLTGIRQHRNECGRSDELDAAANALDDAVGDTYEDPIEEPPLGEEEEEEGETTEGVVE